MGQFVGCIEGMREACLALDYPVVSGNVSLYNETNGKGILPTPAIGGVGLIADVARIVSHRLQGRGRSHRPDRRDHGPSRLARSICARSCGREDGAPPPVDLAAERRNGDFVRGADRRPAELTACHDLSDGGLLVALAEMAMAGRHRRRASTLPAATSRPHGWLFGEDQARYLVDRARDCARRLARGGQGRRRAGAAARPDRRRRVDSPGR